MKIKDLFGVLLTSQDVSLYNACDILEWEGEFKHVSHRYFNCIKRIIQEDRREDI